MTWQRIFAGAVSAATVACGLPSISVDKGGGSGSASDGAATTTTSGGDQSTTTTAGDGAGSDGGDAGGGDGSGAIKIRQQILVYARDVALEGPGCVGFEAHFPAPTEKRVMTWKSDHAGAFFADEYCAHALPKNQVAVAADAEVATIYYSSTTKGTHKLVASMDGIDDGAATIEQPALCADVAAPDAAQTNYTAGAGFDPVYLTELNGTGGVLRPTWFEHDDDKGHFDGKYLFHLWQDGPHADFIYTLDWYPNKEATVAQGKLYFGKMLEDFSLGTGAVTGSKKYWTFAHLETVKFDKAPTAADGTFAAWVTATVQELAPGETLPDSKSKQTCIKAFLKGDLGAQAGAI